MKINWQFILSKLWKAVLMGLLIAVGIALFPQAKCAIAQTCNTPRDNWCGDGRCCAASTKFKVVADCHYNDAGYCAEDMLDVTVRCDNPSNCAVSQVLNPLFSNRLSGGYWYVGSCKWEPPPDRDCADNLLPKTNKHPANCCLGQSGGGGGGGRRCTPRYAPPTIDDTYTVDPPHPIVWTQEQPPYGLALGVTVNDIKAHGGKDTACGTGQAKITSLTINLTLTQRSIDWILGELSQRYINVHIKDTYPKYPERPDDPFHPYAYCAQTDGTSGIGTPDAELDCRFFRPLDPGEYAVNVTACQSDGKCTTKTLPNPIKVWLLESTLGR